MLDTVFRETVTLRRATSRTAAGGPVYATVRDEVNLAVPIRCRIERGVSRSYTLQTTENEADAFLYCRRPTKCEFRAQDLVVDRNGAIYRVLRLEPVEALFGSASYLKVTLKETRDQVEEND